MSVPTWNSSSIDAWPVSARLVILRSPSRPRSSSSWRLTISRSTSSGAAPGHSVRTLMTGWLTSGASWIGIRNRAT